MKYLKVRKNNWISLKNTLWVFILEEGKYRMYKERTMVPAEIWNMYGTIFTLNTALESNSVEEEEKHLIKQIIQDLSEYTVYLEANAIKMLDTLKGEVRILKIKINRTEFLLYREKQRAKVLRQVVIIECAILTLIIINRLLTWF